MTLATLSLPAEAASVPVARRFVRTTLEELGLTAAWESAAMLVSELVTNAVLHARTVFAVEVERDGQVVRISVLDGSPVLPRQRTYGSDSTTGRGLRLVATLSVAWGVEQRSDGKRVWFEVLVSGDSGKSAQPWAADVDALLAAFDDPSDDDSTPTTPRARTARSAA